MTIKEIVKALRSNTIRRRDLEGDESLGIDPTIFNSSVAHSGAKARECDAAVAEAGGRCPPHLKQFWRLARTAKLFEDLTSGQWGLEILSPWNAVGATNEYRTDWADQAVKGDLIIGRFIGDSDMLLLIRADPDASDFGRVIVIDGVINPRADWDIVAASLGEFLNRYADSQGEMYWTHVRPSVEATIAKLKQEWQPRRIQPPTGDGRSTVLGCEFADEGASEGELMATVGLGLPHALAEFWMIARSCRLWGLAILSPADAASESRRQLKTRPDAFNPGDLVAGHFVGESDLLVVPCDQAAPDFGRVLVADPIAPRQDWSRVGDSFGDFLTRYIEAAGDRYWDAKG